MEIKRTKYLQRLIDKQNNNMIKVITGLRRSGKSYLLYNLFRKYLLENIKDDTLMHHCKGGNVKMKK